LIINNTMKKIFKKNREMVLSERIFIFDMVTLDFKKTIESLKKGS